MTLVMVSNLSQKRSSPPNSLLTVRLPLMLPMPLLPKLLLRLPQMPLLPLLLLETSSSSETVASVDSLELTEDSLDLTEDSLDSDSVVETTDGLRSVTSPNTPLLTLPMTPTPTLSPNT